MKECLNCKKQYQERRSTSKFCSNKCRAAFARKNEKYGQESLLSKFLLVQEELTDTLLKIKQIVAHTPYSSPKLPIDFVGDEPLHRTNARLVLSYNELRDLIQAATSSAELHKAWKEVERNKELASWQLRELGKLKDYQQTKIDF